MSMKIIMGDLITKAIEGEFDLIAHGCNCLKNFGAGIALDIKKRLPAAYQADLDEETPELGNISIGFEEDHNLTIVNCYTQHGYGKPYSEKNKTPFDFDTGEARYDAIRSCFQQISIEFDGEHIGLPLIGCGLAGLSWSKVKKIIKEELKNLDVTVVVFNEETRAKFNIKLTE